MAEEVDDPIVATFHNLVNMTPKALDAWLGTGESRAVGFKDGAGGESVGHKSGRHIVALLREKKTDIDSDDVREMHRVVGYIKRHLAQRPQGDVTHTRWAYSLKNWGHDPTQS